MSGERPERVPWNAFPDVVLMASIPAIKGHVDYAAGKSGDAEAAARVVRTALPPAHLATISAVALPARAVLVSVHAVEEQGTNALPEAFARAIAEQSGLEVDPSIVQTNVVNHTGASGFARLARQALFEGDVLPGRAYVIVDDFVGQGGTIANLRGFIENRGGRVVLAAALTGKPHSAKLALESDQLTRLRSMYGDDGLEEWWQAELGFGFDCLTASEARYLERATEAHTIRDRITAEEQAGGLRTGEGGAGGDSGVA